MEIQITQENRDKLQSFKEVQWLSNEFKEANHSENEALGVKDVLSLQGNKTKLGFLSHRSNLLFKLKKINISCCGLTEIPGVIFGLKYLTELNLSNNSLESLPNELGNLYNLTILKLSGNKLKSLPKSLKQAQQLNYLDLSSNKFFEVPDVLFYSLWILQVLDLSCNELTKFSDPPACLYKLVVLGMSSNFLNHLPVWIFDNLCQLKYLDISKNPLHLGAEVVNYCKTGIFETLQFLNIENCNLVYETIQILSVIKNLKVLHLGNKRLESGRSRQNNYMGNLKMGIFNDIRCLYLQNVQISSLPLDLYNLKNIEVLDLSDNLLSWLPECFCNLTSLKMVNLTSNQLLFLPTNIGNLVNLKQIHLGNNKLCFIPDSFYNLCSLEFVDLYNNHIEKVNPSIFKGKNLKGIDLELNYLQFSFCEYSIDNSEIKILYACYKDFFRKYFNYVDTRRDSQITKSDRNLDDLSSDSNSYSTGLSVSSFESEPLSDLEDLFLSNAQWAYNEDENWEEENSCQDTIHELFDPNEVDKFQLPRISWKVEFQNNFCPANYHTPSVMKTYVRNFKLASSNDFVEEGQFDSD